MGTQSPCLGGSPVAAGRYQQDPHIPRVQTAVLYPTAMMPPPIGVVPLRNWTSVVPVAMLR
jgi:hypothetical protein